MLTLSPDTACISSQDILLLTERKGVAMRVCLVVCAMTVAATSYSVSATLNDRYQVTPQEKAACTSDAVRLCISAYPDEDKLLACMKQNRESLSSTCRVAFDAGVRRRRL